MGNVFLIPWKIIDFFTTRMRVDINWPFPDFNGPHRMWRIGTAIVVPTIGAIAKLMTGWLNHFQAHNTNILFDALDNRDPETPLITVSNHHSCLDDPLLWGNLRWRDFLRSSRMRWSITAQDICFTQQLHALFFGLGRCVPVIRGNGVYQRAMDFCVEQLNKGQWIHIFPEGKVNVTKEFMRLKWGVGRLISECKVCPIVIPMWHLGMDNVLPNVEPYVPSFRNKVTLLVGKPIELENVVKSLQCEKKSDVEQRKYITDIIQEELWRLRDKAEKLHAKFLSQ